MRSKIKLGLFSDCRRLWLFLLVLTPLVAVRGSMSSGPRMAHRKMVLSVAFSPDGSTLATAGVDGRDRTFENSVSRQTMADPGSGKGEPTQPCWVKLWDGRTGQSANNGRTFVREGWIRSIAFSPDGSTLAAGGLDADRAGRILLWDVASGRLAASFPAHEGGTASLAFSPRSGNLLLSGGQDGRIRLWDLRNPGRARMELELGTFVDAVAFSPDGGRIAAGGPRGLRFWDAASGLLSPVQPLGPTDVTCLAFSPDGAYLACGSTDGRIYVWDIVRKLWNGAPRLAHGKVAALAFSPRDSRLLASGGRDASRGKGLDEARLWKVGPGQLDYAGGTEAHTGWISSVAFSPDGGRLATGSWDHTAKVWEVSELLGAGSGRPPETAPPEAALLWSSPHGVKWYFDGYLVAMRSDLEDPVDTLKRIARSELGRGWVVRTTQAGLMVSPRGGDAWTPGEVWRGNRTLLEDERVAGSEPSYRAVAGGPRLVIPSHCEEDFARCGQRYRNRYDWAVEEVRAPEAWSKPGCRMGEGIVIGVLDTGYTRHAELDTPRLLSSYGWSFEEDRPDPRDRGCEIQGAGEGNECHGAGIASVAISAPGPYGDGADPPHVTGVAPRASVIPWRVTDSVIVFPSATELIDGIYAAIERCDILSISLGTPMDNYLMRDAVQHAQASGRIVVAAAGNYIQQILVMPAYYAQYDKAIAVGGTTPCETAWPRSIMGQWVTISAPSHCVYRATAWSEIRDGEGTSYGTPLVAGVAALWLDYRRGLRFPRPFADGNAVAAFKQTIVNRGHWTPPEWPRLGYGPGIIDARATLEAEDR